MKIGFDNNKYLKMQSEHIRERINQFGDKLYLEFGGKLFDDFHASRVLPGFAPDSKLRMLLQLADQAEIVIVISAADIEKNKVRSDLGITYDGYAVILVLAYGALWLADRRGGAETSSRSWSRKCRRTWCIGALTTVLAMVLYLWSNSQAVYVHRGAVTDVSIAQEFAAQPLFFLRFLLKAVASSVIGAGDSFWGGFLASYLQEETSPEHLTRAQMIQFGRVGNAVASLCVERRGGISAIPEMEEIEERLRG
mgnify:CR=1 FL=1